MRKYLSAAIWLAVAGTLVACETGRGAYERPLRVANVLEPAEEENGTETDERAGAAQPASIASLNDPGSTDASLSHGAQTYRLADLSPGERPDLASDEGGLWMLTDRFEQTLKTSGSVVRDPVLNAYVRDLTCRIAGPHCDDIRVYIVENPVFNAFMTPNGMMVLHTGFLLRARNEAELATVIGHEAGHFLRRHSHQRFQDALARSTFLTFFSIAVGVGGGSPDLVNATSILLSGGAAAYSRDNEREADGYGLLLMYRAGYDPRVASNIWDRIVREKEASDSPSGSLFFASHPSSGERRDVLAEIGAAVAEKMPEPKINRDRFFEHVLPHRAEWLRQETHLRDFDRSTALFDMLLEDDPNPAEILYFKGELHRLRNSDEEEDALKALELYEQALAAEGAAPSDIHRSMGLLYRRQDEPERAVAALRAYLNAVPEAEDRLVVEELINRMTTS